MILQYKGRKTRNEMKSLPYVKCVIEKKGVETFQITRRLEKSLGLRKQSIQFSGIKDTKGKYFLIPNNI